MGGPRQLECSNLDQCDDSSHAPISLMSWNILAQSLADHDLHFYPGFCPQPTQPWNERCPKILDDIIQSNADIVCLQEVEFSSFKSDLLPAMRSEGYEGLVQDDPRKGRLHCHGVATFWRINRFTIEGERHRSRTMITILKDNLNHDHPHLAVVNCHLEGHPAKSEIRVKQLQTALYDAYTRFSHHALLVCGDFNCELHSSACGAYLSFGSCPAEGVMEWGEPVPAEISKIKPHNYSLSSAYPAELGAENPFEHFTYARVPMQPGAGLDQIWYTPSSLNLVGLRQLFKSDEQRLSILRQGLPNDINPSDHIAVGCVFQWDGHTLVDLKKESKAAAKRRASTILTEASELIEVCPFENDYQRREFEYVASAVEGLSRKEKPTREQMLQLKDRKERKEKLLSEVPDEVKQILQKVFKLIKGASKA